MNACVSVDEFVNQAMSFRERLTSAKSFQEILMLWRSTSIAYRYRSSDPFSATYLAEVLNLYEQLTQNAYSAANELTSTKQAASTFEAGYPWVSANLEVCAQELGKTVQALNAFHACGLTGKKFIEFGAGWGNLAIPLAKAGQEVAVIDIDEGFLDRIRRIAARENVKVDTFNGDFLEVARSLEQEFDAVIFQSSFHHCLQFNELLKIVRDDVLSEAGSIFFFSEPIYDELPFPWGLRFDGESLWAILCNHWLELGFEQNFFFHLLLNNGFLLSKIAGIPGVVGDGWIAAHGNSGIAFERWWLPKAYDETFVARDGTSGFGRFCSTRSVLPGLKDGDRGVYRLQFRNFGRWALEVEIFAGASCHSRFTIPVGGDRTVDVAALCDEVAIKSETYVPDDHWNNGDMRRVGVALTRVSLAATVVSDKLTD